MSYHQSISYLFGLQRFGIKLGLSNITKLLNYLGNPHKKLRCIHIGGSNGKGSTAIFLLSIIKQKDYRVGLFTSPHLIDFTERIRINYHHIQRSRVNQLVKDLKRICKHLSLGNITFFEFVTAMAFKYFEEEKADPVIVEVGMGGRLDATNVLEPMLSIITSIALEHQIYLGSSLLEIAEEKAGIIKRKTPLITGAVQPQVVKLFSDRCIQLESPVYRLGREIRVQKTGIQRFDYKGIAFAFQGLKYSLYGEHQIYNAAMAIAASEILNNRGFSINENNIREGLKRITWPGRMEVVRKNPFIILDGAHNPNAWRELVKNLKIYFQYKKLYLVLGVMEDKDITSMIEILTPEAEAVIFSRPKMERAATKTLIEKYIPFSAKKHIYWIEDTVTATDCAIKMASTEDLVCITGSFFSVGEAREHLLKLRSKSSGRIAM